MLISKNCFSRQLKWSQFSLQVLIQLLWVILQFHFSQERLCMPWYSDLYCLCATLICLQHAVQGQIHTRAAQERSYINRYGITFFISLRAIIALTTSSLGTGMAQPLGSLARKPSKSLVSPLCSRLPVTVSLGPDEVMTKREESNRNIPDAIPSLSQDHSSSGQKRVPRLPWSLGICLVTTTAGISELWQEGKTKNKVLQN